MMKTIFAAIIALLVVCGGAYFFFEPSDEFINIDAVECDSVCTDTTDSKINYLDSVVVDDTVYVEVAVVK